MDKTQITTYWQELPWNNIKLKANKHLPKFLALFFIVLIVQTFAELTWEIFAPAEKPPIYTASSSPVQIDTSATSSSLSNIGSYHLFGNAKKQDVAQEKVIDAPETRLRLDLKGVFASTIANDAMAIIATSKGKDKSYHIGDKIVGGAVLHAVYADRVILKRNGKLETLSLPKPKLDSKAFYRNAASNNVISSAPSPSLGQSQQLREMRDTLLKDPAKIWEKIRINPVMKNGEVQGYTFVHNDQKLMKALNIRKTDVITAVNGESLSDPTTLYGLMGSLSKESSLELSIERDGHTEIIQLSF